MTTCDPVKTFIFIDYFSYVRHTVLSRHAEQTNTLLRMVTAVMGMNLALVVLESEKLGIYSGTVSSTSVECRSHVQSLRNKQEQIQY